MIKSITVTNDVGESIKLELARPERSGFVVESIEGIGPGKATINMTEMASKDGSLYNSARVSSRNIQIGIRYLWKDTIEDARQLSYKYFPLKKNVTLLFETDNRMSEIVGYVESNEPNIFSKEEGTDISIICPFPYFYSAEGSGIQTVLFSGIEPMFEFPFSNESLTDPLLEMSAIQHMTENVVTNNGDVETSVTIYIHALGEVKNIAIYNLRTREIMRINTDKIATFTGSGIVASDDIVICTEQGKKSITLIREGVSTNILNCLDKNADWFQLLKGDNVFAYTAEVGSSDLQFKVEYRLPYEGV